jgi:Iap family predicted aminopeptidase
MKRRLAAILLAGTLALGTCACGSSEKAPETPELANVKERIAGYTSKVDHSFAYDIAYTLSYDETLLSNEMGWRTAGSDAEHAAADYLAEKMNEIGLQDVEKVPVTVDKWQFNDASLTIAGTDIDIMPASYATNGTDADGITAEIVDVGFGAAADYEGLDVEGKIVLCGVDQWNEMWIDSHLEEAAHHGAAAIVSYAVDGYARYSDDMINMQDVCAPDLMPCVSISMNQYKEIAAAIEAGSSQATLIVDNEMVPEGGTSYNVVGRIPGKCSDQQIMVSAHYDCYFWGFQDDNCAIGLVLEMANAMLQSGFTPQNDIVFVCHGAEEWGATDTDFDYTTGAWEMINHVRPEWAGKTIAMLNFELPAYYDGAEMAQIACVPEFNALVSQFVSDPELCPAPANDIYPKGIDTETAAVSTMEDGVSYRMAGVPYVLPSGVSAPGEGGPGWYQKCYHTSADNKDSYSADVMTTNLNMYGALAIYLDAMPALQMDFTATVDFLDEFLDRELAAGAGVDVEAYETALEDLRTAAEAHRSQIADLNGRYAEAVAGEASQEDIDGLYAEGRALNKATLAAFKFVQDNFSNIVTASDIVPFHAAYQDNVAVLTGLLDALEEGVLWADDEESGALDLAWRLNNEYDYCFYNFSPETVHASMDSYSNLDNLFWGTNKGFEFADTGDATVSLLEKDETGGTDFSEEIAVYQAALESQTALYKAAAEKDIPAMGELAGLLK